MATARIEKLARDLATIEQSPLFAAMGQPLLASDGAMNSIEQVLDHARMLMNAIGPAVWRSYREVWSENPADADWTKPVLVRAADEKISGSKLYLTGKKVPAEGCFGFERAALVKNVREMAFIMCLLNEALDSEDTDTKEPEEPVSSRGLDKVILRFPPGLRSALKKAAARNRRSMNAEIVQRIALSIERGA